MSQEQLDKLKQWVEDGDTWLGVFENHDLGHRDMGRRCVFPFSMSDGSWDKAKLNETRAPDGQFIGLGWRYILIAKTQSAEEALSILNKEG